MLETLLKKFENYKDTCPITNLRDGCVTFARNIDKLKLLGDQTKDVWLIAPSDARQNYKGSEIKYFLSDHPEYLFTKYHNEIHKNRPIKEVVIGINCDIDKNVVLNVEGLKAVNTPYGDKIQFVHTGGIIIGNNVNIGPFSTIHRGTMEDTIIESGCKFGAYTNIGHNCHIDENTVMAAGVILNGGVKVGKQCWFSSGVLVRHYVNICDNVVVGLGSVVLKDITRPGIYVGNPARYLKPITKGWNF